MEASSLVFDLQTKSWHAPDTVNLLDVITTLSLLERLAKSLPLRSLLSLSRTNSTYRAVLHGFSVPSRSILDSSDSEVTPSVSETETLCYDDEQSLCFTDSDTIYSVNGLAQDTKNGGVRPGLNIGEHQTELWMNLKSISMIECSESFHKKGKIFKTCRVCSMPVCELCIIKLSFSRMGSAFNSRERHLCDGCFESGNPHGDKLRYGPDRGPIDYKTLRCCTCTAKDSLVCSECWDQHVRRHYDRVWLCAGHKCQKILERVWAVRVCLWCNGKIPGHRNREDYWLAFDGRFARGVEVENRHLRWHRTPLCNYSDERLKIQEHRGLTRQPPYPGHRTSLGRVYRNGRYDYWHLLPRQGVLRSRNSQVVQEEQSKSKFEDRTDVTVGTA